MKELIRTINRIGERLKEDNITVYGAQASFFLIVSLIPFAIALRHCCSLSYRVIRRRPYLPLWNLYRTRLPLS